MNLMAIIIIYLTCLIMAVRSDSAVDEVIMLPEAAANNFKIAIFADLHFGENSWTDWGPLQDFNSLRVMSSLLNQEQPDFVIYLGDVITANNIMINNASLYWDLALSPARDRGIPWSTVFGNHDDAPFQWPLEWFSHDTRVPSQLIHCTSDDNHIEEELCKGTTRLELMKNEIRHNNNLSYSKNGPNTLWPSVSNYVLKLSSKTDDSDQASVTFLYFFDSGGGSYPEVVSKAQVKWFQKKSKEINPYSRVPEVIFWHIPSETFKKVAPKLDSNHKNCIGSIFLEDVAAQEAEMGIMKVLEERPSVKAVIVGHNHGLDWCCPYKKLWLCFARHTGYGGYGNWSRGARILEIIEKPSFSLKTWIRMEDGHLQGEVLLSS